MIVRKIPFSYIFFIAWITLLISGLYIYLAYLQPAKLSENINNYLASKSNIVSSIESYELSFTPHLSIIAKNTTIIDKKQKFIFKIDRIEGNLNWRSLFVFKPVLSKITFYNPQYKIILPANKDNPKIEHPIKLEDTTEKLTKKLFATLEQFSIPHYFNSIKIFIQNANGNILDLNSNITYATNSLNLSFKAPDILDGYAKIDADSIHLIRNKNILGSLTKTQINAENISYSTKRYSGDFSFKANIQVAELEKIIPIKPAKEFQIFPMPKPSFIDFSTHFDIFIPQKSIQLSARLKNTTLLPVNGHNIPISLDIPFKLQTSFTPIKSKTTHQFSSYATDFLRVNHLASHAVNLPGLHINSIQLEHAVIQADSDKVTLNGNITGLYPFNPLFYGHAKVDNFSLPRWIGPTRSISAGLYNALDKIKGDLDLYCTLKGVFSPKLTASIPGYKVTGKAITANFLKPDIRFDLTLLQDKNTVTNLNNLFPEINGKNVNKVALPSPVVPIFQPAKKKNSTKKTQNFFVDYHINITVPYSAHIWKLDFAQAKVEIAPDKNATPTISATINNLYGGNATAKAYLYSTQKHQIFANINNVLLEAPVRSIIGYTACTGKLNANTQIALTGSNIAELLNSLEIKAKINLEKAAFHSKTELLQKFNTLKTDINIKTIPFNVQKKLPQSFSLKGNWEIQANTKEENYRLRSLASSIDFSTTNFMPISRKPQPTDIQLLELPTRKTILDGNVNLGFNLADNTLIIKNYRGRLKNSKLIANLIIKTQDKKYWNGNLYFQHFNLADMLKKTESNTPIQDKPLPLNFICENVMDINIKADRLTFYDITTTNFTGNIKIADDKISINNLHTNIKQGKIQALLEGQVHHKEHTNHYTMNTRYKMKAEHIDMLNVTKMRKQSTLMAGTGYIAFQGTTVISRTTDLFKTMNAQWNMQFSNGYFINEKPRSIKQQNNGIHADTEKRQYGSKTNYHSLRASGIVKKGIVETNNITLHGPGIFIQGGGKINLPKNTINAFASATYLGIPEIPIKVTGSLDDPKINVNILTAVGYTLGNIGSSFFDVFNGFFIQPFKIMVNQ